MNSDDFIVTNLFLLKLFHIHAGAVYLFQMILVINHNSLNIMG